MKAFYDKIVSKTMMKLFLAAVFISIMGPAHARDRNIDPNDDWNVYSEDDPIGWDDKWNVYDDEIIEVEKAPIRKRGNGYGTYRYGEYYSN